MTTKLIAGITAVAFLAGCATQSVNVTPSYVPPSRFSTMPCEQLQEEYAALTSHETSLSSKQDSAYAKDAALVAVSLILFWPAAFFVGQDKGNEAELARIKGERQVVERTLRDKRC
jgi:hypothetical protein